MKPIRLSRHAVQQAAFRGTNEAEIREAITNGLREPVKHGRVMYRLNFEYGARWQDQHYAIKQVAPVVVEGDNEIVVVTVYTFFF